MGGLSNSPKALELVSGTAKIQLQTGELGARALCTLCGVSGTFSVDSYSPGDHSHTKLTGSKNLLVLQRFFHEHECILAGGVEAPVVRPGHLRASQLEGL